MSVSLFQVNVCSDLCKIFIVLNTPARCISWIQLSGGGENGDDCDGDDNHDHHDNSAGYEVRPPPCAITSAQPLCICRIQLSIPSRLHHGLADFTCLPTIDLTVFKSRHLSHISDAAATCLQL